jgi:1-phosphofructokinase
VHELAATVRRSLNTVGDVVDAARELIDAGVETVLASLGADGAIVVTSNDALWARSPRAAAVNTTGAGDAALAGFLSVWTGNDPAQLSAAIVRAVSWGYLAVEEVTPVLTQFRGVPGIEVGPPSPLQQLTETA